VCGELGRIVIFSTLTEYVGGLEKNEQRVKTVSADQQEMMKRLCSMRASPGSYERLFTLSQVPINDLSAVCQGNSLSVFIAHNKVS
jgi:hypothetical protein